MEENNQNLSMKQGNFSKSVGFFDSVLVFLGGCVTAIASVAILEIILFQNFTDKYFFHLVSNSVDFWRLILSSLVVGIIIARKNRRKAFLFGFALSAVGLIWLYITLVTSPM